MKIYHNGEYMPVSKKTGQITRQGRKFLGQWRLLGAVRLNNFGQAVEQVSFSDQLPQLEWLYKNGKQRWHIIDLDHGTKRVWMTPKHKIVRS